jgi:hypothetical protein
MHLGRIFLFSLVFLGASLSLVGGNQKQDTQTVDDIDREIRELEDMKRGFEGRALRHENYAEYMQFDQQMVLETRRHLQIAQENRDKAAKVQERIDFLKKKKQQLKN